MTASDSLLRAIFSMSARSVFSADQVIRVVCPFKGSEKQMTAYNLCDGRTSQAEIVKRAKLDKGNFSRALSRWIEAGVVVRVGDDDLPLHVFPISKQNLKEARQKHV